jgi:hypothetical protein
MKAKLEKPTREEALVRWLLEQSARSHACFTGDCTHLRVDTGCIPELIGQFEIDMAESITSANTAIKTSNSTGRQKPARVKKAPGKAGQSSQVTQAELAR